MGAFDNSLHGHMLSYSNSSNVYYYFTSYGLLGASGCGKTTLLTCIIGRRRLNSGDLWVLGGKPGEEGSGIPGPRVGYMPQVTLSGCIKNTICNYYLYKKLLKIPLLGNRSRQRIHNSRDA